MVQSGEKWNLNRMEESNVLIGEYAHTLDPKGRMILPSRIRENMGDTFILTKGLDGCVAAYTLNEWSEMELRVRQLPSAKSRTLKRFLFSSASEVTVDKQGRVLIPTNLREYANLSKNIVTNGNSTGIEIWDESRWKEVCESLTQESIAEAMDELGF